MDVYCAGMYRACSTWQYEVVARLLERYRDGSRLGFVAGRDYDGPRPDVGWRVLKTHEGDRRFAGAIAAGRALAVYAYRDLRDVVFSLMHKRAVSFEVLLRRGMIHQVLANDRFWSRQPGLLVQRYEDLVARPTPGVFSLATFLGLRIARSSAASIAAEYSFEKNRARAGAIRLRLMEQGGDLADPAWAQVYDGETLLHWNHLRDGRVGGWRERATPRQRQALGRIVGDWLIEHGYEPDDSWVGEAGRVDPGLGLEVARGALACRLRDLSGRYPTAAAQVRRMLGVADEAAVARPMAPVTKARRLVAREAVGVASEAA